MIDRNHDLTVTRQAELLDISRGSVYYLPRPVSQADLALMRRIDELHLEHPFMGARTLRDQLARQRIQVGRRHVTTLMQRMGITALAPQPGTGRLQAVDGWAWRLARQRVCRAPVAKRKVRAGVPEGIRQRQRGPRRHCRLPRLVQHASPSLQPGAVYAR